MRSLAAVAVVGALGALGALGGCGQMVQHPVPTFAGVGLVFGFGTCEMADVGAGKCGIVGASTAALLGGVTALVYLLTDTEPQQMVGDEVPAEERARPRHHAPIVLPPQQDEAESESGSAAATGSATAAAAAAAAAAGSASGSGSGSAL